MTAKEYLTQAHFVRQRIDAKIEQVNELNDLATRATATMSGMPHSPSPAASRLETVVTKIVDLEAEINEEIDALVDIRRTTARLINAIGDPELQTVLELRYMTSKDWASIAEEMNCSSRWLHKKHASALAAFEREMEKAGIGCQDPNSRN